VSKLRASWTSCALCAPAAIETVVVDSSYSLPRLTTMSYVPGLTCASSRPSTVHHAFST
jgi:hypothetical protein